MHFDSWKKKKGISFYFYRYLKNMTFIEGCDDNTRGSAGGAGVPEPGAAPARASAACLPAARLKDPGD